MRTPPLRPERGPGGKATCALFFTCLLLSIPPFAFAAPPGAAPGTGRVYAPSGRQLAFRVDAPTVRTPEDVRWAPPLDAGGLAFVVYAVDGDTLRLRGGDTVRLIGVDTPETKHPRKPVQRCGAEASAFTRAAIAKRWVSLEADVGRGRSSPSHHGRDKYGRWLAYVHRGPDGFFLNAEIVRQGAGEAYTRFPFRLKNWFAALEQQARAERLGIWAEHALGLCDVPAPSVARAAPGIAPPAVNAPASAAPHAQEQDGRNRHNPPESGEPPPAPVPPVVREPPRPAPPIAKEPQPRTPPSAREAEPAAGCVIKGNIARDGERIYHVPGGQSYPRTRIDTAQGERWFCTEEEARAAGWRRAAR